MEEKLKCTKGEWTSTGTSVDCGSLCLADVIGDDSEARANAAMMAAAKDLYEALKQIIEDVEIHEALHRHAVAYLVNGYMALAKARRETADRRPLADLPTDFVEHLVGGPR